MQTRLSHFATLSKRWKRYGHLNQDNPVEELVIAAHFSLSLAPVGSQRLKTHFVGTGQHCRYMEMYAGYADMEMTVKYIACVCGRYTEVLVQTSVRWTILKSNQREGGGGMNKAKKRQTDRKK